MLIALVVVIATLPTLADRPNVILIMTDDQGYGDLSCHGNPILKTPNLDKLHAESIRMTDFHVDPFCTPTRAALMTGRYSSSTGAFRTSSGRTMLHTDEVTMADVFRANGYATGIFGKWHLGDNYPHRPQDRGFTDTLWHRCGGVGQASDYWGNDYFDDTYEHNGKFEKFDGYCTDVWFAGAMKFIEQSVNAGNPFFCYIPTNAPHGPYIVAPQYAEPYKGKPGVNANFFGMIANLDENVGKLRAWLKRRGLSDNTVFIFMTDNGTSSGFQLDRNDPKHGPLDSLPVSGFNAGMRGRKSSVYDGGHRVPCFIHWPGGKLVGGRDVPQLTAHVDLLPTLIDLCGMKRPDGPAMHGRSLVPLLRGGQPDWPDRKLVLQFQGGAYFRNQPQPWTDSVVMTKRWRLMDGKRLYDMTADPTQSNEVAKDHPEVVKELRVAYEAWWPKVKPRLEEPVRIGIGAEAENPTTLCSQDWRMATGNPPWHPGSINKLAKQTGPWCVDVVRSGRYAITLRQKPGYVEFPLVAKTARLKIAAFDATKRVPVGATGVTFHVTLQAGPATLNTYLTNAKGQVGGAYFTDVEFIGVTK